MNNKCPICNTNYEEGQSRCKTCNWDLSIYAQSSSVNVFNRSINAVGAAFSDNDKVLKSVENWARKTWKKMNYFSERKEYYKEIARKKDLEIQQLRTDIVFELKEKVQDLEAQLQPSLNAENRISALEENLFNLDQIITAKVKEYLENLNKETTLRYLKPSSSETLPSNTSSSQSEQKTSLDDGVNQDQSLINEDQALIKLYSENPQALFDHIYRAVLTQKTQEDLFMQKAVDIIFKTSNQSDYWIVQNHIGSYYLLPDTDLRINTNRKLIKMVFDLKDYVENEQKKFTLVKCAKVNLISQNRWKLTEKGILQF